MTVAAFVQNMTAFTGKTCH